MAIYFGGSRNLQSFPVLARVVRSVLASGEPVHVGCQLGADQLVINSACGAGHKSSLVVFAVAPSQEQSPFHVSCAHALGVRVVYSAGGQSAPIPARYLLRSIAAFQGCSHAVFFEPGPGSLAVARECVKSGLPVFAFTNSTATPPAQIPNQAGTWGTAQFMGFRCWQWFPAQQSLF